MLPWRDMLRAAIGLRITPGDFWRLSLREWRWLTGDAATGLTRARLDRLQADYPDGKDKRHG